MTKVIDLKLPRTGQTISDLRQYKTDGEYYEIIGGESPFEILNDNLHDSEPT